MFSFYLFVFSIIGMENMPTPSITGGDYSNYLFIEPQLTPICFRIRLFQFIFKDFRISNPGGSFLARDATVLAESMIWSSIVGVCGQGMKIEAS
jgi:hypothetical protein